MTEEKLTEAEELRLDLWSDFLGFCDIFFPVLTGREFIVEKPVGRESHHLIIARELTKVADLETLSLLINVQPGSGKSTLLQLFVAWCLSRWPDSNFIYVSFGHELSASNTSAIKRIIESSEFKAIFDVHIRHDSKAKDYFSTTAGGTVRAFGSGGPVTGANAGFMSEERRFTGALILDDLTKPDEAASDAIRASILRNYQETILQRPRGPNVPVICIAQRLHEDDICAHMLSGKDERVWKHVCLKSLDDAGNALCPSVTTKELLLDKQKYSPYAFASQYQQNPTPAGGAVFKRDWFVLLDQEPNVLSTFIVCDTAETNKTYNDATAFGFFGIYELSTGQMALHWIDSVELFIEPKDLEGEFQSFYADCMRYKIKPLIACIEKKSTGTTLISTLQGMRGLEIRDIKRTKASGSKTQRFLDAQPTVAARLVSLPSNSRHTEMCVEHMSKITSNDTHRRDDLADICVDAIRMALIDKTIQLVGKKTEQEESLDSFAQSLHNRDAALRGIARWQ